MEDKKYKTTYKDLIDLASLNVEKQLEKRLEELFYCTEEILQNVQDEPNFVLKQNGEFDAINPIDYYGSLLNGLRLAAAHINNPGVNFALGKCCYILANSGEVEVDEEELLYKEAIDNLEASISNPNHKMTGQDLFFLGASLGGLASLLEDPSEIFENYKEGLTILNEYLNAKKTDKTYKDIFVLAKTQLGMAEFLETSIIAYIAPISNFKLALNLKEDSDAYHLLGNAQLILSNLLPEGKRGKLAKEGLKNIEKGSKIRHME